MMNPDSGSPHPVTDRMHELHESLAFLDERIADCNARLLDEGPNPDLLQLASAINDLKDITNEYGAFLDGFITMLKMGAMQITDKGESLLDHLQEGGEIDEF